MQSEYRERTQGWYRSRRWVKRSAWQLKQHPLCCMCLKESVVTAASVADHIVPHKGDANKFWLGALQSLCLSHHNSTKKIEENRGYLLDIGNDGFPTDTRHPFNKQRM